MEEEKSDLNNIFSEIKKIVSDLSYKVDVQSKKIEKLEDKIAALENKNLVAKPLKSSPLPPPPPKPAKDDLSEKIHGLGETIGVKEEHLQAIPKPEKSETEDISTSLEEKIGGKWFAKIGVIVFVLGVSFFLKYAFDNDWIGETGRVLLGVLTGLGFLAFGEKNIRKYFNYGQIITGGGLVILYLSIYSAQNFYGLIDQYSAFAFMTLVTAIGIALSLRYNAPALIIASVIGGFSVPFLTSTGKNNIHGLFSYIILLDLAVLIVSFFKKWRWLNLVGMLGTFFVFNSWYGHFYTKDQLFPVMMYLSSFFFIYSISSLIYNLFKKENSSGVEQAMTLVTGFVYFAVSYNLLENLYHDYLGYFSFVLAFYYFILAYATRYLTPKDENLYSFLAFFSVGFLTIAIPVQFSKYIITILWLIEALLLFYAGLKSAGNNGVMLRLFAFFVFVFSLTRVVFFDSRFYKISDILLLNKVFLTSLLAVTASYLLAFMYRKFEVTEVIKTKILSAKNIAEIFLILASVLTVFSVTRDVIYFHDHKISQLYSAVSEYNRNIELQYGYRPEAYESVDAKVIQGLRERKESTISVFWLLYASVVIVYGVLKRRKNFIVLGTVLNSAIILKLLLNDFWQFDTISRPIVAFFTIFVSYLTAYMYFEYGKGAEKESVVMEARKVMAVFLITANVLTIFAISREIFLVFENQKDNLQKQIIEQCSNSYSKFSNFASLPGGNVYTSPECEALREKAKTLENKASVSISLFWLFYAIVLITLGFIKRYKWVRIGGIALLIVSLIKLFIFDLWSLGQLYRIIAFTALGLVLLGVSYFYQKNKDVFKEIIK